MPGMNRIPPAVLFVLLIIGSRVGASEEPEGAYFGQSLPGRAPEVFSPGFISTEACEMAGTFSPAGDEYFFSRRPAGSWSKAAKLRSEINATQTEYAPSLSPDGRYLFFHREI